MQYRIAAKIGLCELTDNTLRRSVPISCVFRLVIGIRLNGG